MLNEAYSRTQYFDVGSVHSGSGVSVFISHKHSDIEDLEGLLGLLKTGFNVNPYLDCLDDGMPLETCAQTAIRIKQVISFCPKFILLATEDALLSRWCNWEVGIADKLKLSTNDMAILPLLERKKKEEDYKGNEYLRIYPYIESEKCLFNDGYRLVVNYPSHNGWTRTSLINWLNNRIDD